MGDTIETAGGQIITDYLVPSEVCQMMRQGPVGERWVEMLWVVRKGYWTAGGIYDGLTIVVAKHVRDCGPVENFSHIAPLIIPGDDETTVAEFLHEGERHRHDLFAWNHQERVRAESTLIADVARARESRREYIRNRTVSGPYVTTERNVYNRAEAWRRYFDERARRTGKRTIKPGGGVY